MGALSDFVRDYLQRVVDRRDLSAVDDLVSPAFRGSGFGWPADREALRQFYAWQADARPDWSIEVQETLELGNVVAVRAVAAGTVPEPRSVEWLSAFRVEDGLLLETQVLELRELPDDQAA